MTEYDPRIAAILDRLVPPPIAEPSWEELLRDADALPQRRFPWRSLVGGRRRKRRVLVLATTVLVAVVVAIPALAVSKGWWFLGSGAPRPQSDVAVVTSGRAAGIDWTLTAYVSADRGVCVAMTPDVGRGDMGGMSCGHELRGEPALGSGEGRGRHWVGYVYSSLGLYDFPDFVFGPVADGVDRVDIVLSNGQILRTDTLEGPDALSAPLDFYAVQLPGGVALKSVIARDRSDNVLEERACQICARLPTASSERSGRKRRR